MRKVKLSDCGDYILSPKISSNILTCENYITTDNMLPNKAGIVTAESVPQNLSVTQYIKNDILLSNIRPYFKKIWLAECNGGCSADVLVFRTNINYDSTYIKYCLSQDSFFAYDMAGSKGSKMPRGDKNHILNFELLDYDLKTQKNIGNLLLSIDNKIKLNDKINLELENIAKKLYEYWFVQFDFPDENERPYKSSGGKMVYNEVLKREIPLDWEIGNLYTIADYYNGLACQKFRPMNYEQSLPVVKIGEMHNGINADTELVKANIPAKNIIDSGDILFSWSATLEIMLWTGDKAGLNQHIFKVVPKSFYSKEYVYQQLSSYVINFVRIAEARKTTMGHITTDHLKQSNITLPPKDIIEKYSNSIEFVYKKIIECKKENLFLIKLRDFILPMLMNGQVTIQQQC